MIRRTLSVFLTSIVLLSAGYCEDDFNLCSRSGTETLVSEDSNDSAEEFRRTIKISLSGQSRTRCYHSVYDTNAQRTVISHQVRYHHYPLRLFPLIPATRLLVTLGSLII